MLKKTSILIDDLKPTIDEWNAKGGIGNSAYLSCFNNRAAKGAGIIIIN